MTTYVNPTNVRRDVIEDVRVRKGGPCLARKLDTPLVHGAHKGRPSHGTCKHRAPEELNAHQKGGHPRNKFTDLVLSNAESHCQQEQPDS